MKKAEAAVARGATSLYFSNVAILVFNTAYFVLLTNLLPTFQIGIIAALQIFVFATSLVANLSLPQTITASLPLPHAVVKFIPEFLSRGERGKASRSFHLSFFTTVALASVLSYAMYAGSGWLAANIFNGQADRLWIQLAALDAGLYSLAQLLMMSMIGLNRIAGAGFYYGLSFIVKTVAGAALVIAGLSVGGVMIGYIVGDLLLIVIAGVNCRSLARGSDEAFPARMFFGYALPLLTSSLIVFGVFQMDKIFALLRLTLADLGIYNIAIAASTIAAFAPNAITTALVPSLSAQHAAGLVDDVRSLSRRYTRYVALIAVPSSFGLASLATALTQLFGPQYIEAAFSTAIISVTIGLTSVSAVYNGCLLATRNPSKVMQANLAGLGVLILSLFLLIPSMGFEGAAWSRVFMFATISVVIVYATHRRGYLTIDSRAYASSIASSLVMGFILYLIVTWVGGYQRQIAALPLLIPFGATIYFVTLRFMKAFTRDDIEFLESLLPKRMKTLTRLAARIAGVK